VRQADVLAARNRWMRVVGSIAQLLVVGEVEQNVADEIMVPVRKAETKAASGEDTNETTDPPSPPETPAPQAAASASPNPSTPPATAEVTPPVTHATS
jgi:hypothetical protein